MNAEGGIDDLLGNGILGHSSLPFLAKSLRRKERNNRLRHA